jgi:hypothetical protein
LISKLKIIYGYRNSVSRYQSFFDIEVFIEFLGPARAGAELLAGNARCSSVLESLNTDCSAGNSLQLSFWRRRSNSTLSGLHDKVTGEAEGKAASQMALLPLVA